MARVKICGFMRMEDVEAVNRLKPDMAGFMFAQSRRRLSLEEAKRLTDALDRSIVSVGVFVDERSEITAAIAEYCGLGAVQLHGAESEACITRLRKLLPAGTLVIKAVRIRDEASVKAAEGFCCDLLLDAYHEALPGGTGLPFDWRLLRGFRRPYILAGGLNAGNVAEAIRLLEPYGVDVSTGVETDGAKDARKIEEFIRIARGKRA
jgi:phosphoribosylanthranilate isomerase